MMASLMSAFIMAKKDCSSYDPTVPHGDSDIIVQLVLSLSLGISAFFGFCVSRPNTAKKLN
jgi:hypothetical protein